MTHNYVNDFLRIMRDNKVIKTKGGHAYVKWKLFWISEQQLSGTGR